MNVVKKQEGSNLTVALERRLDTVTSPQLEGELRTAVNGITELNFDLARWNTFLQPGCGCFCPRRR